MVKNTFTLNGKMYEAKPFTYNLICDLDDMGISIADADTRPNSFIRGYIAICIGKGKEVAGVEIQNHLINGGELEDIVKAMSNEMENSDFFQALKKNEETDAPKTQKKSAKAQ